MVTLEGPIPEDSAFRNPWTEPIILVSEPRVPASVSFMVGSEAAGGQVELANFSIWCLV